MGKTCLGGSAGQNVFREWDSDEIRTEFRKKLGENSGKKWDAKFTEGPRQINTKPVIAPDFFFFEYMLEVGK